MDNWPTHGKYIYIAILFSATQKKKKKVLELSKKVTKLKFPLGSKHVQVSHKKMRTYAPFYFFRVQVYNTCTEPLSQSDTVMATKSFLFPMEVTKCKFSSI